MEYYNKLLFAIYKLHCSLNIVAIKLSHPFLIKQLSEGKAEVLFPSAFPPDPRKTEDTRPRAMASPADGSHTAGSMTVAAQVEYYYTSPSLGSCVELGMDGGVRWE
jgi:hypothetical protein